MQSPIARSSSARTLGSTQRYLTFRLADETYAVRVLGVQEILQLPPITWIPQLPAHLRGVLNLRGRIIPVIDMRQRFGLTSVEDNSRTCVVVVQIESARRGKLHMGLVVDAVEEVVQIPDEEIAATPEFGGAVDTAFLLGIAKIKGSVTALLDLDRVLTSEQLDATAAVAAATN
jgi:purine-binding chemotaxis protein CheW